MFCIITPYVKGLGICPKLWPNRKSFPRAHLCWLFWSCKKIIMHSLKERNKSRVGILVKTYKLYFSSRLYISSDFWEVYSVVLQHIFNVWGPTNYLVTTNLNWVELGCDNINTLYINVGGPFSILTNHSLPQIPMQWFWYHGCSSISLMSGSHSHQWPHYRVQGDPWTQKLY